MTRRLLIVVTVTLICVLTATGAAFAGANSGYAANPVGQNPHKGYLTSTSKCAVCHAVHKGNESYGGVGSELLLRSSQAEACTYCHVNPAVSTLVVYGGVVSNYNGSDNPYGHNDFGATPVTCTLCHQVHAAQSQMTSNSILTDYMLIRARMSTDDPPGPGYDWDADWTNEGAPLATDSKDVAITKWCTRCHTYWPATAPAPIDTHLLTAADSVHSFSASTYCVSCHNSDTVGGSVPAGSAFPHFTDGARFLMQSATDAGGSAGEVPATAGENDAVCLRCHRNGSGTGVGLTF